MSLTILCATRADACVQPFLADMVQLASRCHGYFGVVLDGDDALARWQAFHLPARLLVANGDRHQQMQAMVSTSLTDYVCILDDDERCPSALAAWLEDRQYLAADFWYVSRAWLYPDAQHFITSRKHWPNPSLRVGRRSLITVPTRIHAGWMEGEGTRGTCPHPVEHHKFLLRSLADREAEVAERDALAPGAGMYKQYLPERLMVDVAEWAG